MYYNGGLNSELVWYSDQGDGMGHLTSKKLE